MASIINVVSIRSKKEYKPRVTTRNVDYHTLYRFEEENIEWLADHFLGSNNETRGGALNPVQKMKIFLRYVAKPGFQSRVGEDIGCDQTTVSKIIAQVGS